MAAVEPPGPRLPVPPGLASPERLWSAAPPKARPWATPLGVGLAAVVATAYTTVANPNTSHAFPLCPLRYFTHLDCPFCGSLRAVHSLSRGDLVGAADHNVVFVVMLPFLVLAYGAWLGRSLGLRVPSIKIPPRVMYGAVFVLVAFAVLRNIPALPGYAFLNSTAHLAGHAQ